MKERLSERIYLFMRDGLIPFIVLLFIGLLVKAFTGKLYPLLDIIIIGAPILLIFILRIIFTLYQKISDKKSNTLKPY